MDNQKYDEIMRQITADLTGDPDKDLPYLKAQMEMYKDHELGTEIVRACGRLIFEALPKDTKKELNQSFSNYMTGIDSTLEEVKFNIYKNDPGKALNLMEGLMEKVEALPMFRDDEVSTYFTFEEPFEEILYTITRKPEKTVRQASIPFAEIYFLYGNILFEVGRYEDARAALEKAMRWNPMSARIAFEHAETYKIIGDIDKTEQLTKEIFKIAFKPALLARCYRNLGYIFIEKQKLREAIACYYLSLQYEPDSKQAQSELYYINQQYGVDIDPPTMQGMKDTAKAAQFPLGPDEDILGIAYTLGKQCLDEKKYDLAEYLLQILYDLTDDPDIGKLIELIPRTNEKLN